MKANDVNDVRTDEIVPMSEIFNVIGSQGQTVIETSLQQRANVSESARAALNAAIDNSGITIGGFRKPSRAQPPDLLNAHVLDAVLQSNDKLASAVLRVWSEACADLARLVTEHLEEKGIPVLDTRRDCFHSIWPKDMCLLEGNILSVQHSEFDHHDVALMLCYLSGRFPEETTLGSSLFNEWLDRLEELPPDAPEWDESPAFIAGLVELSSVKVREHDLALRKTFDATIAGIAERFEDELHYLIIDVSQSSAEVAARPELVKPAHFLAISLESALEAYREVRPQAPTRDEELKRADERNEREAEILAIVDAWMAIMATSQEPDDSDEQAPAGPDAPANLTMREYEELEAVKEQLTAENARLTQTSDALRQAGDKLRSEKEDLAAQNARLTQARDTLQQSYDKLRMEKEDQSKENSSLKRELRESKQREDYWRVAAAAAPQHEADAAANDSPQVDSVHEAITTAARNFPSQLVIALNSRSKEDTSFQRPSEVYDALAWLATDYHRLRSNPAGVDPDFDKMLKAACPGWSHVPHQSAVTIGMFKDWYYTTTVGVKYELTEHLGRGSSGNPQHTIRIAFAWDGDTGKVIVGYIGPHQRNQGS